MRKSSASDIDTDIDLDETLSLTRPMADLLPVEDEFLLTQMKTRMGLSNFDLAKRFDISEGKVTNTFLLELSYHLIAHEYDFC